MIGDGVAGKMIRLVLTCLVACLVSTCSKEERLPTGPIEYSPFLGTDQLRVQPDPYYTYEWDTMQVGVLQHHDRSYTYDVVPNALKGGLLFRGIHRQPQGTAFTILLKQPASIYFFFHVRKDGGYTPLFANLEGWELCKEAPQYDIHSGHHGLDMVMYRLEAKPGVYSIPRSTSDRGCFNMVFVKDGLKNQVGSAGSDQ